MPARRIMIKEIATRTTLLTDEAKRLSSVSLSYCTVIALKTA
jgi:hypothetical protein